MIFFIGRFSGSRRVQTNYIQRVPINHHRSPASIQYYEHKDVGIFKKCKLRNLFKFFSEFDTRSMPYLLFFLKHNF